MSRSRHPNKHIEAAIQYAEDYGWTVAPSAGHAWGRLFCTSGTRGGCIISVWSTPRNPENHARHIRREVDHCPHWQSKPQATNHANEENEPPDESENA